MKKGIIITIILVAISLMCLIAYMGYRCGISSATHYETEQDTTVFVDTISYYNPVTKDSAVIMYVTRYLPVSKPQHIDTEQKIDTSLTENYAQNNGENIPLQVLSDERDSIAVEIPITQKRYESDNYLAYISGYEPKLDSIFVFQKTTVVHERSYKPPNKWHIGIAGGYGYGFKSKQVEPYIGIGITYSIISF